MYKFFLTTIFTIFSVIYANQIEGRWIPGGFGNTMYIFQDNLRYTIYNIDDNFEDLDIDDAIPNPHPYEVDGNTISIDLHFGNIATYEMDFRCDGQVVDFYYDEDDDWEGLHSTMFREGFDYIDSECDICSIYDEEYCSWMPECQWDNNLDVCSENINNSIEGRWHLVGWDNLIMYQFVETDYFEEAGLKYTIYVNTDGEFDDVLDDDYTGGTPDYYNVDGDTITIDYHFGNVVDYQMNFRCEGQVVEFYNADIAVFTLYREFYDYSQCYNMPNECFDLSDIDFGDCEMYLGSGWNGYQCDYFSGCDWIIDDVDYSSYFFDSIQECEEHCECEDGEIIDDNPCNPMECFDGQWYEIIIDCMEDMGIPCEGGLYMPPDEGECCSECILFGDINYDSSINILDVIGTVQLVLNGGYNEIVDINYDGTINILDIIEIIQIILD